MTPTPIELLQRGADADFSLTPGLYSASLRPHVLAFAAFVRLADEIAGTPWLGRPEKIARLEILEAALDRRAEADWSDQARGVSRAMGDSIAATGVGATHARRILQAGKEDVLGLFRATWADLLDYCALAAAPVGRHLLDLHSEDAAACAPAADALCAAVRILKRLRTCHDPTVPLNRLCIPEQFLEDAKISAFHLRAPSAKGQTRAVLDRVLDGVDRLLDAAEPLPNLLRSTALRGEARIALCRARPLAERMRTQDLLERRVELTRWERLRCKWSVFLPATLLGRR